MANIVQKFTSSGSITFPAGVVRARVRGYGGGGGGGGGAGANLDLTKGSGGGGGGCAVWQNIVIPVSQGISYTVTVGAGGIGGSAGPANTSGGDGYAGGNSIVSSGATNLCLFVGASGGQHGAVGALGHGGLPLTISNPNVGIGDNFNAFDLTTTGTLGSGGPGGLAPANGQIGTAFMNPSIGVGGSSAAPWYVGYYGAGSAGGGGGGGAAGPGGNGGNGGAGGVGTGAGSPGASAAANSGAGGGGGGGGGSSAVGAAGGNGGSGYIEIEYEI